MMNCKVALTIYKFIYRSHFRSQRAVPPKKSPFFQPTYIFSPPDDFFYRIMHCTCMCKCA